MRVSIFLLGLALLWPWISRINEYVRKAQSVRLPWVLACALLVCLTAAATCPTGSAEWQHGGGTRTVWMHSDGTYEDGYAWFSDGCIPPDYGSFAERYETCQQIAAIALDLCGAPWMLPGFLDAYVWADGGGVPGEVLAVEWHVEIDSLTYWPQFSRHLVYFQQPVRTDEVWWVGFWPRMPFWEPDFYVGADLDGPGGGSSMTKIAPGQGYPTGWQDVAVRWGPTAALGIGAEVEECPTPVESPTWGAIKAMFRE